jgi:hypothetical protein
LELERRTKPTTSRARRAEGLYALFSKVTAPMRAMAFIWAVILVGGIAYFSIVGLTHH